MQIFWRCDSITSEKFSFGRAHALVSNFPIFRHQCRSLARLLFVCCCVCAFTQINQKLCSILSELRSNVCQNVFGKTDSILLSFFFHCLWHHQISLRCEYATIFFFFFVTLLCRIVRSNDRVRVGWFREIQSASNFCPIKESTNWLCLCLTNQLNRIYLTMTRATSRAFPVYSVWLSSEQRTATTITITKRKTDTILMEIMDFRFAEETKITSQHKCRTSRGLLLSICRARKCQGMRGALALRESATVCLCVFLSWKRARLTGIYYEAGAKVADKNSLKKSLFLERFRLLRAIFSPLVWKWHFAVNFFHCIPSHQP